MTVTVLDVLHVIVDGPDVIAPGTGKRESFYGDLFEDHGLYFPPPEPGLIVASKVLRIDRAFSSDLEAISRLGPWTLRSGPR
jgi:hypothetical protein